ncbi:hypothetical protein GCM10010260_61370 [Streptomyces filipinensis]|uniref:Uncharacterized protein n=1 Tax=Streptomyces filipinensis TaxID=66887 RepID=A0A918IGC1_9ACTN|nr:hypothetical protein GCM10010260_61370 [Streptomyces filipinensis]
MLLNFRSAPGRDTAQRATSLERRTTSREQGTELTDASATRLIDPRTRDWAYGVAERLGVGLGLLAPLRQPGDPAGVLRPGWRPRRGSPPGEDAVHGEAVSPRQCPPTTLHSSDDRPEEPRCVSPCS